ANASNALAAAIALSDGESKLRFGVHLGEVTPTENGDLLGHDVNVAARVQAEAPPGGILVSEIVRKNVAPEMAERLLARGRIRLAKMRETMRVFALDSVAAHTAAPPVLAVLAFDTPSREHSTRALSDGISEEILYAVSRLPGIKVLGATSSFAFRGRDK